MANVGDILYLKSGSQAMTVVAPEQGDSQMVQLMSQPGVIISIPLAALTDADPVPVIRVTQDAAIKTLTKQLEPAQAQTPST